MEHSATDDLNVDRKKTSQDGEKKHSYESDNEVKRKPEEHQLDTRKKDDTNAERKMELQKR